MKTPDIVSSSPLISVVIACYNQTRELELTLRSFLEQDISFSAYELLVVDDHSPDYTARQIVEKLRATYPSAALVYVRQNRTSGGTYAASAISKNLGLRLARGRYVFFNNAEIVQAGQTLSYIKNEMTKFSGDLCLRGMVIDHSYEEITGKTIKELEELHDLSDRSRERVASADHAGLAAVPRQLLLAVGGIDERFDYWGKEDLDLAARLKRAGATYRYDHNLKSFHVSHPANHVKQGDYVRMCALLEENNGTELVEANLGRVWGAWEKPPITQLGGTVVLGADERIPDLIQRLEDVLFKPGAEKLEVLVTCTDSHRRDVENGLAARFRGIPVISLAEESTDSFRARVLPNVRTKRIAYIGPGGKFGTPPWERCDDGESSLTVWVVQTNIPQCEPEKISVPPNWMTTVENLSRIPSPRTAQWRGLPSVGRILESGSVMHLSSATDISDASLPKATGSSALHKDARVLALIPHYKCEAWLAQCLESRCDSCD
jgi:glycosyl transferase family 2